MRRATISLAIVICLGLIGYGIYLHWVVAMLDLDYPIRLAGLHPHYPAAGTLAYYRVCIRAVLEGWAMIIPFSTGIMASTHALLELLGRNCRHYSVPRWLGLSIAIVCAASLACRQYGSDFDPEIFALQAAWPAVIIILCPPLWRHALLILAFWAGVAMVAMGERDTTLYFVIPGILLSCLNFFVLLRHE